MWQGDNSDMKHHLTDGRRVEVMEVMVLMVFGEEGGVVEQCLTWMMDRRCERHF